VPRYDQLNLSIPSDTVTCSGDEIELLATVRHGAGGYQYYWSTGSNDEFITVEPIEQLTNRYTVTVIDQCGSSVSGEINVETGSPEAFFDGEFIDGVNLMLRNKSNDAISYEWDFDDGNTSVEEHPWHKYEEDGAYSVRLTAIDENGCRDNAVVIFESPLRTFIPNAFTPNGDGKNDVFKIEGTGFADNENITRFNIEIFNRWGEVVFSSNNPYFEWDANNEENGIYVYRLTIEGLGSQKIEKTGSIQILH
jgi:gliding motility-associated-like protein